MLHLHDGGYHLGLPLEADYLQTPSRVVANWHLKPEWILTPMTTPPPKYVLFLGLGIRTNVATAMSFLETTKAILLKWTIPFFH